MYATRDTDATWTTANAGLNYGGGFYSAFADAFGPPFAGTIDFNNGLPNKIVYAFAVIPDGSGHVKLFAATDGGAYASTDNGAAGLTALNSGFAAGNETPVYSLAVFGGNLFAGSEGGLWIRKLWRGSSSEKFPIAGMLYEAARLSFRSGGNTPVTLPGSPLEFGLRALILSPAERAIDSRG